MGTCSLMECAGARARRHPSWEGAFCLMVLVLQAACATGPVGQGLRAPGAARPPASASPSEPEPGTREYAVDFLEAEPGTTRPVQVRREDLQRALKRLARGIPLQGPAREVARQMLQTLEQTPPEAEVVEMSGRWVMEVYRGQTYTLLPESQTEPVPLEPLADSALREQYLTWCADQGGGDCRELLDDGPYLTAEDRRVLALSLALGSVLEETEAALGRQVNGRLLASLVAWTLGTYFMLWLFPEPVTKGVAAVLTLLLVAWLGLDTLWGLMDGWSALVFKAYEASTFAELKEAGEEFGRLMGEDAARAMVMAVATVAGRTVGEVAGLVKSLPGAGAAGAQWQIQGGTAVLAPVVEWSPVWAEQGALATAVQAVESVALMPQGPLAVVLLKQGPGAGGAPGGRAHRTVVKHRGGNRQVELGTGERWHLPRGKSVSDIPRQDPVGDQLQEAVSRVANQWNRHELSFNENRAIADALKKGKYWLARLLEREARGRFVERTVRNQFEHLYDFSLNKGVDVVDPATGIRYEILSGTASNMARHGRRMAGEFFRMLTF